MINVFSMRTRKKLWTYGLIAVLAFGAITLQTDVLSRFPVKDVVPVYCNLPLTLVIVWGAVFGGSMPPITPDELRLSSVGQIFLRQMLSGSVSGALVGMFMAALYSRILPVFPLYLPVAGWFAGYFCLRNINKQNLLVMPLTFAISLLADCVMAAQLSLSFDGHWLIHASGRAGVMQNLMQLGVAEATLNTIIAPFIYFPLRRYYDVLQISRAAVER